MKRFPSWILFAASRYLSARRRDKSAPSSILPIAGIATGVMALIVVLSVMNGFQMGFIESILEISSYHIRVEAPPESVPNESLLRDLRSFDGIASVLPFLELQTIARGSRRTQQGCLIRGIPADAASRDPGLAKKLNFEEGSFDLSDPRTVLLGAELARSLSLRLGDEVSLLSLSGAAMDTLSPEDATFRVSGIFRSGFYEYDLGWGFIALEAAERLHGKESPFVYGVKLRDRWKDEAAVATISRLASVSGSKVVSWRTFNRAFFGALRTEKVMMFLLVGLIFIVVGLNVFQAQRRAALERREEIGLLRAVGASSFAVRLVFACDGFLVGLTGATAGLIPGLLISNNIALFFSILEFIVNSALGVANMVVSFVSGAPAVGAGSFSIFSPAVFYLKEIPSRTIPAEAAAVFLFGLLSATIAAALASGRASRERPAEVLRYE
ncbi:MAG: ABC transporter permease [Treponemataceae bacterium]